MAAPSGLFDGTNYQIQHQLGLLKEKFKIEDETGKPLLWVATPAISLKREFHVYADEDGSQEVLTIKIRKLMEVHDTWDVSDPGTHTVIGTIEFETLKSLMAANWKILDPQGQQLAELAENTAASLEHDVTGGMVPRNYSVVVGGATLAKYSQEFMSLMLHLKMDFSADSGHKLDRRLGLAAGIIVANKALTENKGDAHI